MAPEGSTGESAVSGYVVLDDEKFMAEVARRAAIIEQENSVLMEPLTATDWILFIVFGFVIWFVILMVTWLT